MHIPGVFLQPALAIKFSLVAPSGALQPGATVRFTINIDTQGATVRTSQVGMTYETQYLQYVSTTPGNAMTTVSASQLGGGKILFSGENTSGYSGQGVFAYIDLKIVATTAGSTQLCTLWVPTPTATIAPTNPAQSTVTPQPTYPNQPTSPPQVTRLPTSGITIKTAVASSLGLGFIIFFALFYWLDKKIVFKKPKKT